uniref:Uncharacterized protein n=1 Tax=Zea mays TaxID=4577 RepID=A0A804MFJ7_MAIZE
MPQQGYATTTATDATTNDETASDAATVNPPQSADPRQTKTRGWPLGAGEGWPVLLALVLDHRTAENALLNCKVTTNLSSIIAKCYARLDSPNVMVLDLRS